MNLVSAGLTDYVDHAARSISVFRAQIAVLDAKLLNRVGVGKRQIGVDISIVVSYAIHLVIHTFGRRAIGFGVLFPGICAAFAVGAAIVFRGISNTGREEYELLNLSPIK